MATINLTGNLFLYNFVDPSSGTGSFPACAAQECCIDAPVQLLGECSSSSSSSSSLVCCNPMFGTTQPNQILVQLSGACAQNIILNKTSTTLWQGTGTSIICGGTSYSVAAKVQCDSIISVPKLTITLTSGGDSCIYDTFLDGTCCPLVNLSGNLQLSGPPIITTPCGSLTVPNTVYVKSIILNSGTPAGCSCGFTLSGYPFSLPLGFSLPGLLTEWNADSTVPFTCQLPGALAGSAQKITTALDCAPTGLGGALPIGWSISTTFFAVSGIPATTRTCGITAAATVYDIGGGNYRFIATGNLTEGSPTGGCGTCFGNSVTVVIETIP